MRPRACIPGRGRRPPDGKRIAFVSIRRRRPAIYTMNVDGSQERRLTAESIDYAYPDWQPLR